MEQVLLLFLIKSGGRGTNIRPLVPTPHQPVSFCEAKDIFFFLGLNVSNNPVIINRKRGGDYVNLLIANVEGLALERP